MIKILIKFWPVLVPFLVYGVWYLRQRRGRELLIVQLSEREARLWRWTLYAALLVLVMCAGWLAMTIHATESGIYHPATLQNGVIVPGYTESKKP